MALHPSSYSPFQLIVFANWTVDEIAQLRRLAAGSLCGVSVVERVAAYTTLPSERRQA